MQQQYINIFMKESILKEFWIKDAFIAGSTFDYMNSKEGERLTHDKNPLLKSEHAM